MNSIKKSLVIFFLFVSLPIVAEETICSSNTNEKSILTSTPTNRFDFVQDSETVTDKKTGLMWSRCPWTYSWNLNTCDGDGAVAKRSWFTALEVVNDNNSSDDPYLGYSDWRLPNIKELASIIERKCAGMAINHQVFGGAGAGKYWSNSDVKGSQRIRVVNLTSGQVSSESPSEEYFIRLVRDVTP